MSGEANAIRISSAVLEPFGIGIPKLNINATDIMTIFGDKFLRMLKESLVDCARHSSLANLSDNIHTSLRIDLLLRGLAMRSKRYGVSNVRITYTPEHQLYLDWEIHGVHKFQLMLAHI